MATTKEAATSKLAPPTTESTMAGSPATQLPTSTARPTTSQGTTSRAGGSSTKSKSGNLKLSEEETLFLRLTYLILKIGPEAVRELFDKHIPSKDLKQKLAKEKGNLQKLKQRRVIYDYQWDILYPSNGTVSSNDFDLALMVLLLRNIVKVNPPTNGWNELPHQHDQSDGAPLATIKYYRNALAHTKDCSISPNEFKKTWKDLRKAIVGIGGQKYSDEIEKLLTIPLDQSHKDLYSELKSLVHDRVVPPNIQCKLQ